MNNNGFAKTVINATISELVKRVLGLAFASVAGLAIWLYATGRLPNWTSAIWLIGVLIILGVGLGIAQIVYRRSIYRTRYPRVRFRYEVLSKTVVYRIDRNDVLDFRRRVKIKVTNGPLEDYLDQFIWTADNKPLLPEAGHNVASVERYDRVGIWTYIRANFGRVLATGDEYEFEICWPPITNWSRSSPFVSTSTEEPTKELIFEVTLPTEQVGVRVMAEELRGIEALYPFRTVELPLVDGRCRWVVKRPPLYRHFRLRWSWGQPVQVIPKALGASRYESREG